MTNSKSLELSRAQLTLQLNQVRVYLPAILEILQSGDSNWYVSILVENRNKKIFTANQKSHNSSEMVQEGAVLRIYDGYTLYESAIDKLEREILVDRARDLVGRVRATAKPNSKPKYYRAPSWKERLQGEFEPELLQQIPKNPGPTTTVHFGTPERVQLWDNDDDAMSYAKSCLAALQKYARSLKSQAPAYNPNYLQVTMSLSAENYIFLDGEVNLSQSLRRNRLNLMVTKNGEYGMEGIGGLGGRETVECNPQHIENAFDYLTKLISADRLKPGRYKLLMGPDVTGVFAHEAFGHSQEGDTCARGRSRAWELYHSQELVGNQHATIINNPALYENGDDGFGAWGSYYFDEEGWLACKQFLVKEGKLQPPMTNLTSAIRLGVPRSANGKRESWSHGVYTRQTNTYFTEGTATFAELLGQVDYGFLAVNSAGGMEDPKGMGIQVGVAYLEEIKDGKLTGKIFRGPGGGAVQMTGYTPDYLNSILAKSKIQAFQNGADTAKHPFNKVGGCGKYHKELVVAGAGGPYMLLENVLLG